MGEIFAELCMKWTLLSALKGSNSNEKKQKTHLILEKVRNEPTVYCD